jgi:hypothetical protein
VREPNQLIHGDLSGNVLFDDLEPPAIIDITPYWRPPAFATAVIVADALVWEGANNASIGWAFDIEDFAQYLVRALVYRIVTDRVAHANEAARARAFDPYQTAVDLACSGSQ